MINRYNWHIMLPTPPRPNHKTLLQQWAINNQSSTWSMIQLAPNARPIITLTSYINRDDDHWHTQNVLLQVILEQHYIPAAVQHNGPPNLITTHPIPGLTATLYNINTVEYLTYLLTHSTTTNDRTQALMTIARSLRETSPTPEPLH
ncbi:MAG: hypothetical protein AAF125_09675 [Chloroflexota bacterium]